MRVEGYAQFGGRHGESAALKNALAHAGVVNPHTGEPFSEALCFGIAGGLGAGYSFCPSTPRHGLGSGISVVGRYKTYAADATWYQGFCDRIGTKTHVTETTAPGMAYQNLVAELAADRPTVVWCSRTRLPFLSELVQPCDLAMHSFLVYEVDEAKGIAHGADRAPTRVTVTLNDLAEARNGICSHKNRTLTFESPKTLTRSALKTAVLEGIRACSKELLEPKIKTFSLPGLETWAKMIANGRSKDGWPTVFADGLLYTALRDVFDSIETSGTGGGLFRGLHADFLAEAAEIALREELADVAATYRDLGGQWTALADAALPDRSKPCKQTKELLRKKCRLYEEKGEPAQAAIAECAGKLRALDAEMRTSFPLKPSEAGELLENLRGQIVSLYAAECDAAKRLKAVIE